MLDENDKLTMPLPLPYNGQIYSVEFLNNFIDKSIKDGNNQYLFLEQIGVQTAEYSLEQWIFQN